MQTSNTPLKTLNGLFLLDDYKPSERSLLSNYNAYTSEQFKTIINVLDLPRNIKKTLGILCSCASFRSEVDPAYYLDVKAAIDSGDNSYYESNGKYFEVVTDPSATRSACSIAEMASLKPRTIFRHIKELEDLGIIDRHANYETISDYTAERSANTYTFNLLTIDQLIYDFKVTYNQWFMERKQCIAKRLKVTADRAIRKSKSKINKIISAVKNAMKASEQSVKKTVVRTSKPVKSTSHTTEAIFSRFEAIELYNDIKSKSDCFGRRNDIALSKGISCLFNSGDKVIVPNVNTTGLFYTGSGSKLNIIGCVHNSHAHIYVLEQALKELHQASDIGTNANKKVIGLLSNELDTAKRYAGAISSALKG
ncbi:hypothetical protein VXS06_14420 [Photobacterium toruni]|uniref:Helix-turn-helix domain protein n=1 Tax=Photobacterium toruni TaxID=1935446 RepID=A0ABU6L8Q3_9GAMM|nr:hypothetical protein [Photobacterium toruni]